jgi:hypothetical protein
MLEMDLMEYFLDLKKIKALRNSQVLLLAFKNSLQKPISFWSVIIIFWKEKLLAAFLLFSIEFFSVQLFADFFYQLFKEEVAVPK